MKQSLTILTATIALCATSTLAFAAPRGAGPKGPHHRKANAVEKRAEKAAAKEEAIIHHVDAHAWKKDPEARDHRHENLRDYTNHTYKRIVRLLTMGALEEADGKVFKTRHAAIVAGAKTANQDGLNEGERETIRTQLNTLNDDINGAIKAPEQGDKRTPIVNRAQHRFEQLIAFGIKSGRLSTLEASSLRRKVAKLEGLEDRLKAGKDLSTNERERLMKEVLELRRDLTKSLRD